VSDTGSEAPAINHILTGQAFDTLIGRFQGAPLVAVDTEAASFHRHKDRIYLIQLSSRDETAVVDPLAVHELSGLGTLLSNPAIEVIFHDADYDLRILDRDYGFHAVNLFDTRIAAQLLNEPGIGLAALLEKYVGVKLDKRFQRADWSVRPLKPGMLQYAADDTRFLPVLRDLLKERLLAAERWSWAKEEFELLEGVRWNAGGPPGEAYLRMKGARTLKGRQLVVLRALFQWRERIAAQLDRAPFRIVHNDTLLAVAKAQPRTPSALQEAARLSPDLLRRWGEGILGAVESGLAAPQSSIPVFERSRRPPPDPERDARLERLKAARNAIAQRLDLAPGVLCANGLLEAIANQNPDRAEELEAIPDMRRWQREVLGKELIEAAKATS